MHRRGLIAAKEKHPPTPKEDLLEEVGFNPASSRWAKAACIFHHQRREHLGCPRPHPAWTLFPAQTSDPCQERPVPPHCPVMRPAQPLYAPSLLQTLPGEATTYQSHADWPSPNNQPLPESAVASPSATLGHLGRESVQQPGVPHRARHTAGAQYTFEEGV